MKNRATFANSYQHGLREFVRDRSERRLQVAYELGRTAVQMGLGVLDVAFEHTRGLAAITRSQSTTPVADVVEAAGEFLIESLASFEMVQRGVTEARSAAFWERRRARMLRELSSVLSDVSVASAAPESVDELAQLVCEITCEATGAARARLVLQTSWAERPSEATAERSDAETWSDLARPHESGKSVPDARAPERVTETLNAFDGRTVGTLEIEAPGGFLGDDDRATVAQVAQMTAAWLERAQRNSS
jgi:Phosphoserine phosphatase RsbU, N-terminal domain